MKRSDFLRAATLGATALVLGCKATEEAKRSSGVEYLKQLQSEPDKTFFARHGSDYKQYAKKLRKFGVTKQSQLEGLINFAK